MNNMEGSNQRRVVVCVLGKTGGGKSTFLNTIINSEYFRQSAGKESCTDSISTWEGKAFGQKLLLVDVPGYKDSQGRDQEFLDAMLEEIRRIATVNLFIFVFSSAERLSADQLEGFIAYKQLLGIGNRCWEHVAVAYTRCDYSSDDYENIEQYLAFLKEQEEIFKEAFNSKFQYEINVYGFGLKTKQEKRKAVNQQAIEVKMHIIMQQARNLTYSTEKMSRAFSKDFLMAIRQAMDSSKEELRNQINSFVKPENQRPILLKIVESSCEKLRQNNSYISQENYIKEVMVDSFEAIKQHLSSELEKIVKGRIEALKVQIKVIVRESSNAGITDDFSLDVKENVAGQIIAGAAGGLALGVAISIAADMFIIGGVGTYVSLVSSGGIAALGLSATAYTVATAGVGLVVAAGVGAMVLVTKSNWSFDAANDLAVDELLKLMARGKSDMLLKIAEFWDAECREINNRMELYAVAQEEAKAQ